jgi:hypothetical protein
MCTSAGACETAYWPVEREGDRAVFSWHEFTPRASILLVGAVLMIAAERRQWRPPLWVTVAVALALRGEMAVLSYDIRPYDTFNYFIEVGRRVLAHQDLLNHKSDNPALPGAMASSGWSYLPVYAFPLGAMYWLFKHHVLPWYLASKLVPIAADTVVAALVGNLAGPDRKPQLRRFQYACNPVAILVCAVHGQVEPVCLMFAAAALLVARRHPAAGGVLLGLAIGTKTWPALLLPAVIIAAGSAWRARARVVVTAIAVPAALFVTLPITTGAAWSDLGSDAQVIKGYRSITGTWGWTALADAVDGTTPDPLHGQALSPTLHHVGTALLLGSVLLVLWRWRRADGVALASALTTTFLVVASGFGAQYLVWQAPFQTARPNRWTIPVQLAAGAYAGVGYLMLSLSVEEYQRWATTWYLCSFAVIALLLLALLASPRRPAVRRRVHARLPAPAASA